MGSLSIKKLFLSFNARSKLVIGIFLLCILLISFLAIKFNSKSMAADPVIQPISQQEIAEIVTQLRIKNKFPLKMGLFVDDIRGEGNKIIYQRITDGDSGKEAFDNPYYENEFIETVCKDPQLSNLAYKNNVVFVKEYKFNNYEKSFSVSKETCSKKFREDVKNGTIIIN